MVIIEQLGWPWITAILTVLGILFYQWRTGELMEDDYYDNQ